MSLRTRASLASVLGLLVMGGIWASAQVGQTSPSPLDLVAPTVIAGSDLGFRVESYKDHIPTGQLVVRINGHWVDAQLGSSGMLPAVTQ